MKGCNGRVTGILLAGGLSRRMGLEKGMIRIGDRYLFQYPLGVLESVCDDILISSCRGPLPEISHLTVCDEVKGIGPMGGIHACLRRSTTDYNLVLSYDLPMVNTGLMKFLLSHRQGHDLVVPAIHPGRPEPLCGVYHRRVADIFDRMIQEMQYAVHLTISKAKGKVILIDRSDPFFHPDLFLNIKRKDKIEKLPPKKKKKNHEE